MNGRRLVQGLEVAAAVAGVLGVVVAVVAYVYPRGPVQPRPSPSVQAAPPAAAGGSSTASTTRPLAPSGTLLTALPASSGGAFVSRSGDARHLVLPCPRDTTQNTQRTVSYEIHGRFHNFTATVHVTGAPAVPGTTTLEVVADDLTVRVFRQDGNGSGPIAAALTVPNPYGGADPAYAQRLSLRLTCELTGPTLTLTNPILTG
jgi:hypothetical protein